MSRKITKREIAQAIIEAVDESVDNSPNVKVIKWRVDSLCQFKSENEIKILCEYINKQQNFYRFSSVDRTFVIEVLD
jgi:hypothetical protein